MQEVRLVILCNLVIYLQIVFNLRLNEHNVFQIQPINLYVMTFFLQKNNFKSEILTSFYYLL